MQDDDLGGGSERGKSQSRHGCASAIRVGTFFCTTRRLRDHLQAFANADIWKDSMLGVASGVCKLTSMYCIATHLTLRVTASASFSAGLRADRYHADSDNA